MTKKRHPGHHILFLVFNLLIIFAVIGVWLIYRLFTDNFALAG